MSDQIDRFLRLPTVIDRTGLSAATIYRKIRRGEFPKQVAIAPRCSGWRESAILAWQKNPNYFSKDDQERLS